MQFRGNWSRHLSASLMALLPPSSLQILLVDCSSKFGTYVHNKKLATGEEVELHHNDVIKFGQGPSHSKFR